MYYDDRLMPFPPAGETSLRKLLHPGDSALTYGHVRLPHDLWPPWEAFGKAVIYQAIRDVQRSAKTKSGKRLYWSPLGWRATHVRKCLHDPRQNLLWEVTHPRARWAGVDALYGKEVTICRPLCELDLGAMRVEATRICEDGFESVYDGLELGSFLLSSLLGSHRKRILRFDRGKRYVCSTGAAWIDVVGGKKFPDPFEWQDIPPAYLACRPDEYAIYHVAKATP